MIPEQEKEQHSAETFDTVHDLRSPFFPQVPAVPQFVQEAFLHLLSEEAPVLLWSTDEELRLVSCAGRLLTDLEIFPDQIIGTNLLDHLSPEGADGGLIAAHKQALQGQPAMCQAPYGGTPYRAIARPLRDRDGSIVGCIGAAFELTPTKAERAEQARRDQALLLEREQMALARAAEIGKRAEFLAQASLALDACHDSRTTLEQIARLGVPFLADWCVVDVIEEGGAISRCAAAADLSKQNVLDELAQCWPASRHLSQPLARVLRSGDSLLLPNCSDVAALLGPPRDCECQRMLRTLDARSMMAVPLRTRGQMFGVVTFVSVSTDRAYDNRDLAVAEDFARRCSLTLDNVRLLECAQREIAERRWAEETMLRGEEHLRQASKMEAVGRLAGGIAHDFNNILTAILGYAELLQFQLPPGSPAREAAEAMQEAGERAARVTRHLLTFSRKQPVQSRAVDLNNLLINLKNMLRRLIGEDLQFVTSLEPSLGSVWADPGQLEQVAINLVLNARDAMPNGGRLTIETRNTDIDTSWSHLDVHPGAYVLLSVRDTGIGMPEQVRKHLFEPFFTTKGPGEGTGLGLAIAYSIVKQAGGFIDVRSEQSKGTVFEVYLPRGDRKGSWHDQRPEVLDIPGGTETVLLVEDDEVIRGLVGKVLRDVGYTVLVANDGVEALRAAAEHDGVISLLLTDVIMPRLGGAELADRLAGVRPGLKVLYLSGYTNTVSVLEGIQGTGNDFLQKPFTPQALACKIRQVLDS